MFDAASDAGNEALVCAGRFCCACRCAAVAVDASLPEFENDELEVGGEGQEGQEAGGGSTHASCLCTHVPICGICSFLVLHYGYNGKQGMSRCRSLLSGCFYAGVRIVGRRGMSLLVPPKSP